MVLVLCGISSHIIRIKAIKLSSIKAWADNSVVAQWTGSVFPHFKLLPCKLSRPHPTSGKSLMYWVYPMNAYPMKTLSCRRMQALELAETIAPARPAQEGAAPPLPYADDPTARSLQNSLAFGLHHWGELGSPLAKLSNATWSVFNERLELVLPDVRSGATSSSGIEKAETIADTYAAGRIDHEDQRWSGSPCSRGASLVCAQACTYVRQA